MKTYDLYFVRGVNMYVFNTREDALARTIIAELIQACSKAKRGYPDSKERLIEEIAHVLVSSLVVARIYDINEDDIVNEINKKADKYGFCRVKGVNKK